MSEWRVKDIASDFKLIDSWELPIDVSGVPFMDVYKFLVTINPAQTNQISKILFATRHLLGRIFNWDDDNSWLPVPETGEMSLKQRLTTEDRSNNQADKVILPKEKMGTFKTVYLFEKESLIEVSNKTIFSLIHYYLIDDNKIKMDIYVKSRGFSSELYMGLIRPFRHIVVYPAWLKLIKRSWEER